MSSNKDLAAAHIVNDERRHAEAARQQAAISVNRLRYFLFSDDEDYLDISQGYTQEDQYDLMSAVARHYNAAPDSSADQPMSIDVSMGGFGSHWEPEVNQPKFTISMSPFFIEGFRVVKKASEEDPFRGKFIFKDRIEYSEHANRLILERSAFTRYFRRHVGTDIRVPTAAEISSIRDVVHASFVAKN